MATSRIPPVSEREVGLLGRLLYRITRRRFGEVPEPFSVTYHHRKLFWAMAVTELAYEKASTVLPARLRSLAVYRVATVVGCSWCVDFGTMLQRLAGLDVDRLRQIDNYATSPLFDETERLVLAYADAMTAQPMTVTDEQVAELESRLGRAGLIELTQQIALENMRARANSALGITEQGFDVACQVRLASSEATS